jgi:hypothetical protein
MDLADAKIELVDPGRLTGAAEEPVRGEGRMIEVSIPALLPLEADALSAQVFIVEKKLPEVVSRRNAVKVMYRNGKFSLLTCSSIACGHGNRR